MSGALGCTAVVLRKKHLPQRDTIVVLLTREFGKVVCFARNLRSKTSRRAAHLQTGNLVTVSLNQRNDRFYLEYSTLITGFSSIKQDFERMNYLYVYLSVIDALVPENQQETDVFDTTLLFMKTISRVSEMRRSLLFESIDTVLIHLGYAHQEGTDVFAYIEELSGVKIATHDIM